MLTQERHQYMKMLSFVSIQTPTKKLERELIRQLPHVGSAVKYLLINTMKVYGTRTQLY